MAREMKKITEGRVKDKGKTWFPQLVDKCKDVCTIWHNIMYSHNRKECEDTSLLGYEELQ